MVCDAVAGSFEFDVTTRGRVADEATCADDPLEVAFDCGETLPLPGEVLRDVGGFDFADEVGGLPAEVVLSAVCRASPFTASDPS